jgi:hypothetical protein
MLPIGGQPRDSIEEILAYEVKEHTFYELINPFLKYEFLGSFLSSKIIFRKQKP